jgi:hypothetical protein
MRALSRIATPVAFVALTACSYDVDAYRGGQADPFDASRSTDRGPVVGNEDASRPLDDDGVIAPADDATSPDATSLDATSPDVLSTDVSVPPKDAAPDVNLPFDVAADAEVIDDDDAPAPPPPDACVPVCEQYAGNSKVCKRWSKCN